MTNLTDSPKIPPITRRSRIASGISWVGKAVDEPEHHVWCTSPIVGSDGKVHLFASRWPKVHGFDPAWSTHSEIAHYIGDRPEGPFRFANVALPANPGAPWNSAMHCPAIARAGGKYVLLYQTFDRRPDSPFREGETIAHGKMYTCMATSDSLDGPWVRQGDDGMIIEPSKDPAHWTHQTWAMDNPTFLEHAGKYYIYFKAGKKQFLSRYGYAVSDRLEGPYRVSDGPCTDNISYIEDATAFKWDGKFCLLTTDNFGDNTGIRGGGILWLSDRPTNFRIADAQIGYMEPTTHCPQVDTSRARAVYGSNFRFERPGILMLNDRPAYFYAPCGINLDGADHTCSYVMRIDL